MSLQPKNLTQSRRSEPTRWALLIGVDDYMPGTLRCLPELKNLSGCVNDITLVEDHFHKIADKKSINIYKLIAPTSDAKKLATYANIVNLFEEVTSNAAKGDLVYIHMSGHGSRVQSIFADLKHKGGDLPTSLKEEVAEPPHQCVLDEAFLPTDIREAGKYLRDVELAVLLQNMAQKGLIVTIALDFCYGGGMSREGSQSGTIRGLKEVDTASPLESDLATATPYEQLVQKYSEMLESKPDRKHSGTPGSERSFEVRPHWLTGMVWESCVFFAACGEHETAKEDWFKNGKYGAFTYYLVNQLNQLTDLTCNDIKHKIDKELQHRHHQHVVLAGETDRVFFRDKRKHIFEAAIATQLLSEDFSRGSRWSLSAGAAHGVSVGDEFDIQSYPSGRNQQSRRLGRILVTAVEPDSSLAESATLATPRCLAMRVPKIAVRLLATKDQPLLEVQEQLRHHKGASFLPDSPQKADFNINGFRNGYNIRSGDGKSLENKIPAHLSPQDIPILLEHVSKYQKVLGLKNEGENERRLNVSVDLGPNRKKKAPRRCYITDAPTLRVLPEGGGGAVEVAIGDSFYLRIENKSDRELCFALLELGPSWEISQIYPQRTGANYEVLAPGTLVDIALTMRLPKDYAAAEIVYVYKVCFSSQPTSFRWLEQPKLRASLSAEQGRGIATDTAADEESDRRNTADYQDDFYDSLPESKFDFKELKVRASKPASPHIRRRGTQAAAS